MTMTRKLAILASVAMISAAPMIARAATVSVDATVNFIAAVTLTHVSDIDYGTIEFAAAPTGADTVVMDTTGNLSYNGSAFSGATTGTTGAVNLTGTSGNPIDVYCDATATLTDSGGTNSINVTAVTINDGTADHTCAGIGSVAFTFNPTGGTDAFTVGGTLDGGTVVGTIAAGTYATTNPSGNDIQIDAIYQ